MTNAGTLQCDIYMYIYIYSDPRIWGIQIQYPIMTVGTYLGLMLRNKISNHFYTMYGTL